MLDKDISNLIHLARLKRLKYSEPSEALFRFLVESEDSCHSAMMVYDFQSNNLFFANIRAAQFLGINENNPISTGGGFLENILHPSSYQFILANIRLNFSNIDEPVNNACYIKSAGRSRYAWVYVSARVSDIDKCGVPGLIYISFIEIEKAVNCYLKMSNGHSICEAKPLELLNSLKTRDLEMLNLIAAECSSKEMAQKLNISQYALDAARKRLIKKLGVRSVAGLVKIAMSLGAHNQPTPVNILEQNKDWINVRSKNGFRKLPA